MGFHIQKRQWSTQCNAEKIVGKKTEEIQKCKNIDLSKLPPCKRSHAPHCRRVNYKAVQFKNAHLNYPDTPHPRGHGWIATNETESINQNEATNEHILELVWSEGPILPDRLIDLITADNSDSDSDEDEDEDYGDDSDESDMDDSDEYDSE